MNSSQRPNRILDLHERFLRLPFGDRFFSAFAARQAPYFKTVSPLVRVLEPNRCEVLVRKRKAVQNHIGTMHVIAIANGLEMAMGFMAEASIPAHLRWIPKGMQLEYPAKGETDIRCIASVSEDAWRAGDLVVPVEALDDTDTPIVTGTVTLWISEKPSRSNGGV